MKQILIVEDDSFLNKMLSYNLTADGYGVTSALNYRTAAEAHAENPAAIILEVSKYPAISCCFSYRDRIVMPGDEAVMD